MKQIAVGYSGGIDSTAVLIDFASRGYCVDAVYLQLNNDETAPVLPDKLSQMGITMTCIDSKKQFTEHIKEYFANAYKNGLTPNPCAMCNRHIKFSILSKYAAEKGYEGFSTGHYICISNGEIHRGNDSKKDQSYFVSTVKKEALINYINSRNCTATKQKNRELLVDTGIHSERKESQDICFINGDYGDYLEKHMGFEPKKGIFRDLNGNKIGDYAAHYRYTIGQREGLSGGFEKRLYVKSIDTANNEIILADEEHMLFTGFRAKAITVFSAPEGNMTVKTRYRQTEIPVRELSLEKDSVLCSLENACRDITPGQIAVFYRNETVVMSAEIMETY